MVSGIGREQDRDNKMIVWQRTAVEQDNYFNTSKNSKFSQAEFINRLKLARLGHSANPTAAAIATAAIVAIEKLDGGGR